MLAWLSVCSEVQTCIWPSWCHCHSLSLASVKSRLVLPSWYQLTRVVPDIGPLNGCVCVCVQSVEENFLKYWEHIFNKPDIISCSLSNHSTHVICCDTCNADHSTCRGWKLFVTSVMGSSTVVTSAPAPLHFIPVTFSLEIFSPTPKLPGMLLLLYLYVVSYHYHTFLVCWSWCNDAMHYSLLKENFDIFCWTYDPCGLLRDRSLLFFSVHCDFDICTLQTLILTYFLTSDTRPTATGCVQIMYVRIGQNVAEISWLANTHTHLTALFPGLPGSASTRKVKPIWISLKQETVSGSGISKAICKSAPCSRQITTPAPHRSVFYRPDALPATQPTASKH